MIIGSLDREIALQKKTTTVDGTGQPVESWSTEATVYAQVIERQGMETFEDEQKVAYRDDRFRIYYYDGLRAGTYRLIYNGFIYDIKSVVVWGRNQWHEIMAQIKDTMEVA